MRKTAPVEECGVEEKCRGNPGTLQDRHNRIVHLPEPVIERQMNTGVGKGSRSVQRVDDIAERDRLEVPGKELHVGGELRDSSEAIQIAYVGYVRIAHHVVERHHKRHSGERAHPRHGYPGCPF